jgi:Tol biopolymer transport system component
MFVSATATVLMAGVAATAIHVAEAAFPGSNGKIAFSRQLEGGNGEVFVMNADGSGQTNLTNDPAFDYFPAGSPDGRKIAFGRCPQPPAPPNCEIFVMNADGSGQTNLTKHPATDVRPAWSPDGRKIAFGTLGRAAGDWEIFVMNSDGSGPTNMTNSPTTVDWEPAWSPDGTRIAFTRYLGGTNWDIWVMNADGSGQTNLTNNLSATDVDPDWSPDGTRITYTSLQPGTSDIWVMNADGGGQTNLTNTPSAFEFHPVWSPDGTKVVFDSRAPGANPEIFVMNADGSGQASVTNNPLTDAEPDWLTVPAPPKSRVRCVVPTVIGLRLPAARNRIHRAHCSVGRVRYARSTRARGRVILQRPKAGARLRRGAHVNLVVSRGRKH